MPFHQDCPVIIVNYVEECGVAVVVVCSVMKLRRCWITDEGCIHLQHILRMDDIALTKIYLDYNLCGTCGILLASLLDFSVGLSECVVLCALIWMTYLMPPIVEFHDVRLLHVVYCCVCCSIRHKGAEHLAPGLRINNTLTHVCDDRADVAVAIQLLPFTARMQPLFFCACLGSCAIGTHHAIDRTIRIPTAVSVPS